MATSLIPVTSRDITLQEITLQSVEIILDTLLLARIIIKQGKFAKKLSALNIPVFLFRAMSLKYL